MKLNDDEFSAKYFGAKPTKEQTIVVSCLKGGRAVKGQGVFESHGYGDVQVRRFSEINTNSSNIKT